VNDRRNGIRLTDYLDASGINAVKQQDVEM
jgi:hypothetical protein